MEAVYIVLACILCCVLFLCVFVLGALFCKHMMEDAKAEARYDAVRYEYFRLAGVRTPSDPQPYVPPMVRTPRAGHFLPGMAQLDRMLRSGKRGTVMWRAGDRRNAGQSTTN